MNLEHLSGNINTSGMENAMQDYKNVTKAMERFIHKYNQVEKKKRTYGTDMLLSRAEIHTVAAVGDTPGVNVTTLAQQLGITKGAASQMIYRLVDKGLVEKSVSPNSDTEVCLTLTQLGKKAYKEHEKYHATSNDRMFQLLRDLPEDTGKQLVRILNLCEEALDERLKD